MHVEDESDVDANMGFQYKNGRLYCDELPVDEIASRVADTPFYLYSLTSIQKNVEEYAAALAGGPAMVAYAFKANSNLALVQRIKALGCGAAVVSENELRLALAAGFSSEKIVFNGNGKTVRELVYAARQQVMINVDSEFDLENIKEAAREAAQPVRVLIRINPDIDPKVHPYVSTGIQESKFGIDNKALDWFIGEIRKSKLELVGVHCHLGSTIEQVDVFRDAALRMVEAIDDIRSQGLHPRFLNIGGGLGIDYEQKGDLPSRADLINSVRAAIPEGVTLILEPGRSIVGDAGILVCKVIGVKKGRSKQFIVVDASMTELIRPSLYGAYHRIGFCRPLEGEMELFDVVGPVCESGDFLGKDRRLPSPKESDVLAVFDVGAYGYAMGSNYNARMRPPEYLVQGTTVTLIRRRERFEDYVQLFEEKPVA